MLPLKLRRLLLLVSPLGCLEIPHHCWLWEILSVVGLGMMRDVAAWTDLTLPLLTMSLSVVDLDLILLPQLTEADQGPAVDDGSFQDWVLEPRCHSLLGDEHLDIRKNNKDVHVKQSPTRTTTNRRNRRNTTAGRYSFFQHQGGEQELCLTPRLYKHMWIYMGHKNPVNLQRRLRSRV